MLSNNRTPILAFGFILLIFSSCSRNFQFSVLEVKPLSRNTNQKSINKISNLTPKDSFNFLFFSDTQVAYDQLEEFVKHVNHNYHEDSIAFILHGGDYTDYGVNFEFSFYYDEAKNLKFPVIGTIGNHDMLSNGREIYRKLFGKENFSFSFGDNKFIIFNTNSREVGFNSLLPDLKWLKEETENTTESNLFYLSHVPPISADFDPDLKADFIDLLSSTPKTRLSMHGHTHSFEFAEYFDDGVNYLIAPTLQKKQYVKVTVHGNKIQIQQKFF